MLTCISTAEVEDDDVRGEDDDDDVENDDFRGGRLC